MCAKFYKHYNIIRLALKVGNMAENTGKNTSRFDNWFHARRPKHQSLSIYIPAIV
jgi:hypothetical protein